MKKLMVYLVYRGNIYDKIQNYMSVKRQSYYIQSKNVQKMINYTLRKYFDRPQFEIYKIIQEKDYDGVPKIKELFYSPEKTINTYYMKNVYRATQ